ncbi:hypothetical protein ABZ636_40750 [Streptomyces sp. NPDC007251]|uniref:hypothetical protein n=1 Tax=Streptomyces sp. NPDC007251 TaxID=3154483 RepID=UPI0033CDAB79
MSETYPRQPGSEKVEQDGSASSENSLSQEQIKKLLTRYGESNVFALDTTIRELVAPLRDVLAAEPTSGSVTILAYENYCYVVM